MERIIIKNLLLSGQALFSSLSATGSIQNLSLHDIYFKEGSTVGGILCATMTGGNIFNCHVESDLDIQSASSYIGGLVGQANANAIISQCSYTGDITANLQLRRQRDNPSLELHRRYRWKHSQWLPHHQHVFANADYRRPTSRWNCRKQPR